MMDKFIRQNIIWLIPAAFLPMLILYTCLNTETEIVTATVLSWENEVSYEIQHREKVKRTTKWNCPNEALTCKNTSGFGLNWDGDLEWQRQYTYTVWAWVNKESGTWTSIESTGTPLKITSKVQHKDWRLLKRVSNMYVVIVKKGIESRVFIPDADVKKYCKVGVKVQVRRRKKSKRITKILKLVDKL